jgi:hypothetical protein
LNIVSTRAGSLRGEPHLVLGEEPLDGVSSHGLDVLQARPVLYEVVRPEACSALGALGGVLPEVGDVARGLEHDLGVDDGGLYLQDVLLAGEVAAPGVLYVTLELGAQVAVGVVAALASVDLVAGPVEASPLGDLVHGLW